MSDNKLFNISLQVADLPDGVQFAIIDKNSRVYVTDDERIVIWQADDESENEDANDVLIDERLDFTPLTSRPIKLILTYRGKGEAILQNKNDT